MICRGTIHRNTHTGRQGGGNLTLTMMAVASAPTTAVAAGTVAAGTVAARAAATRAAAAARAAAARAAATRAAAAVILALTKKAQHTTKMTVFASKHAMMGLTGAFHALYNWKHHILVRRRLRCETNEHAFASIWEGTCLCVVPSGALGRGWR